MHACTEHVCVGAAEGHVGSPVATGVQRYTMSMGHINSCKMPRTSKGRKKGTQHLQHRDAHSNSTPPYITAITQRGHHTAWPSHSVTITQHDHHTAWPSHSVAITQHDHHTAWPSHSVAIIQFGYHTNRYPHTSHRTCSSRSGVITRRESAYSNMNTFTVNECFICFIPLLSNKPEIFTRFLL